MMDAAPPGWPSRKSVPSYTWPLTTNQGCSSLSWSRSSWMLISRLTSARTMQISFAGSSTGATLSCPEILSPQNPLVRSPPSFFTLSIQPPGSSAGWVGCSNRSIPSSLWITTRYHGLFIMPRTLQYMSLGCTFIESSMPRIMTSPASWSCDMGMSRSQKHQQKLASRAEMSTRPPYNVSSSLLIRYWSSGYVMLASVQVLPWSSVTSSLPTRRPPPVYA